MRLKVEPTWDEEEAEAEVTVTHEVAMTTLIEEDEATEEALDEEAGVEADTITRSRKWVMLFFTSKTYPNSWKRMM